MRADEKLRAGLRPRQVSADIAMVRKHGSASKTAAFKA
jgi:hypothetical protein